MGNESDLGEIDYADPVFGEMIYETSKFWDVAYECMGINKNGDEYSKMSLEKLSKLYDRIDNGLIGFNLISKDLSEIVEDNGEYLVLGEDGIGRFLESQLLTIVTSTLFRNPSHEILRKFDCSLWKEKFKEREYFEQIYEFAGIDEKDIENVYDYLKN